MNEDATLDDFSEGEPGRNEDEGGGEHDVRGTPIPKDWEIVTIDDISEKMGDGGTPSRQGESGYFGGEINWVVVEDVEFTISDSKEKLSQQGLKNSSATLWPEGSVIVTTGASIGEVGIASVPTATKQGITGIIPSSRINSHYLGRYLEANKDTLNRFAQGTTFEEIRPYILRRLELPLPRIEEQRKIASVLYNVDQVIQKTEEIIYQRRTVKQGLMQDIFRYGIDSHGKLRRSVDDSYRACPTKRMNRRSGTHRPSSFQEVLSMVS